MNKQGATLGLWIEMILFVILFLAIIGIIGSDMNTKYNKNYDLTMGLNLSQQENSLFQYSGDIINDTSQGQSSMTDFGIFKLTSVPKILLQGATVVWSLVNGEFILQLINTMQLGIYGYYLARTFQVLYVIGVAFILIKLVLRILP